MLRPIKMGRPGKPLSSRQVVHFKAITDGHHNLDICFALVTLVKFVPIRNVPYGKPKLFEDVPLVDFMYLVFTRTPGESYHRQLRSLLPCLCDTF